MMKITVIAVGKLKENYLKEACAEYTKRLSAYAKVSMIEIPECRCSESPSAAETEKVKETEGAAIIAKIPKGAYVIPLCIEGTPLSSEELAAKTEHISQQASEIVFIIGGSFGLAETVKQAGALKLSFGKITLPHQLMRVVLLEQIYRAFSIINHAKYHK